MCKKLEQKGLKKQTNKVIRWNGNMLKRQPMDGYNLIRVQILKVSVANSNF